MAGKVAYPLDVVDAAAVPDTLAAHLRGYFRWLGEKDSYNIALAGGSLLTLLASAIRITESSDAGVAPIPWNRCNICDPRACRLLDERHVPLDHADSNYKGILTHVLPASPLLRPDRIFPANTALPLEECAADYAGKIRAIMGSDLPRFDIILFGMGEDGHVASLFPDREAINATGIVTFETNSPKPPPNRISLTLPVINNTTFIMGVITGAGKADVLASLTAGTGSHYPVAKLRQADGSLPRLLLDKAAASKLSA